MAENLLQNSSRENEVFYMKGERRMTGSLLLPELLSGFSSWLFSVLDTLASLHGVVLFSHLP